MNSLRRLELSGGVLTAVAGLLISWAFIRLDQEALERLGREFPIYRTVLIISSLYLLPGLVVLFGSYLHSIKGKHTGQLLLTLGSLVNVIVFLFSFFSPFPVPYGRMGSFLA